MRLFEWFEQTKASIFLVKRHIMWIRCHFHAIMLIYKHFAVFLRMMHIDEEYRGNLVSSRKWWRQTKTRRTDQLLNFVFRQSWRLSPHFKSTKHYKNVWRALVYTWHGRFSDVNTYRGWPKYKNCRIVKSAPDATDRDWQRSVREVARTKISRAIQKWNQSLNRVWLMKVYQK